MVRNFLVGILLFFAVHCSLAQITFIIDELPNATRSNDTIYICGNFNNWIPNDKHYILQKQLNGQFRVTVPRGTGNIEYKFTRGDWMRVETSAGNKLIANRKYRYGNHQTVYIKIENWLDRGGASSINYIVLYFFACAFQAIALCLLSVKIQKKDRNKFKAFILLNALLVIQLLILVIHEFSNPIWQSHFNFIFYVGLFSWAPASLFFIHSFLPKVRQAKL